MCSVKVLKILHKSFEITHVAIYQLIDLAGCQSLIDIFVGVANASEDVRARIGEGEVAECSIGD